MPLMIEPATDPMMLPEADYVHRKPTFVAARLDVSTNPAAALYSVM